jgi:hypothetical protein
MKEMKQIWSLEIGNWSFAQASPVQFEPKDPVSLTAESYFR